VFLGDYIDRGPASPGVIDFVRALAGAGTFEVRALMGNHEEVMLQFLDDPAVGASWVEFGGGETLAAYGVPPPLGRGDLAGWEAAREALGRRLPGDHLAFLTGLELSASYGDYLFVHAGVRPSMPLDRQTAADILWIRDEFLHHEGRLDKVVVHGHTPEARPYLGRHRIGIDTGAYATGVLTGVRLFGQARDLLQARASARARHDT
jgi:serine/threonine protein phosphatase 1